MPKKVHLSCNDENAFPEEDSLRSAMQQQKYRRRHSCMPSVIKKNDSLNIGNHHRSRTGSIVSISSRRSNHPGVDLFSNESFIFTPFAQILASLRNVRLTYMRLTGVTSKHEATFNGPSTGDNVPTEKIPPDSEEFQSTAIETLEELEWCLQQLETIQTKRPVSNMASTKFKKLLNRELSHYYANTDRTSHQISEYIFKTFLDRESDEEDPSVCEKTDKVEPPSSPSKVVSTPTIVIRRPFDTEEGQKSEAAPDRPLASSTSLFKKSLTSQESENLAVTPESVKDGELPYHGVETKYEEELEELLNEDLNTWGINMFQIHTYSQGFPLTVIAYKVFQKRNLLQTMNVDAVTFINYFLSVEKSYDPAVPYHNSTHAADVTQSTHVLMQADTLQNVFTDLETVAVLFACAIHDVGHPGVTNQFLINTGHELALLYNDASVLENYHLSLAFKLMNQTNCDIFGRMSHKQRQSLRRMSIELVLATDMSKHMNLLADLKTMVETKKVAGSGVLNLDNNADRIQILQNMIHCADLSNPTKPLEIYRQWTNRIMEEFFGQGDKEKELKIDVSPMCDRDSVAIEKSQISFIDFIVHPLWETWCELVHPASQNILDMLEDNREWYQSQLSDDEQESDSGDECSSATGDDANSRTAEATK